VAIASANVVAEDSCSIQDEVVLTLGCMSAVSGTADIGMVKCPRLNDLMAKWQSRLPLST
jgi:hypothetical protein